MTDIRAAREMQLAYHSGEADRLGALLNEGLDRLESWTYRAPASDDLASWRGVARWCGVEKSYRWHIDREILLRHDGGPFYCPACHDRPGDGWKALGCYECAWVGFLADEALEMARELSRAWQSNQRVQRVAS